MNVMSSITDTGAIEINTCEACALQIHHRRRVDDFKACQLLTLRNSVEQMLDIVTEWGLAWERSVSFPVSQFYKSTSDPFQTTEEFLRTSYGHLQNISWGVEVVDHFSHLLTSNGALSQFHGSNIANLMDKLQRTMCNIEPVLKLAHVYGDRVFQTSDCFLDEPVHIQGNAVYTYTLIVIIETKWKLEAMTANINYILNAIIHEND